MPKKLESSLVPDKELLRPFTAEGSAKRLLPTALVKKSDRSVTPIEDQCDTSYKHAIGSVSCITRASVHGITLDASNEDSPLNVL